MDTDADMTMLLVGWWSTWWRWRRSWLGCCWPTGVRAGGACGWSRTRRRGGSWYGRATGCSATTTATGRRPAPAPRAREPAARWPLAAAGWSAGGTLGELPADRRLALPLVDHAHAPAAA